MSESMRRALATAGAGLALGILAEVLFHGAAPGINVVLWVLAAAGLVWAVARRPGPPLDRQIRWLAVPALFFAAAAAWRDAAGVVLLSLLMLGMTAVTAAAAAQGGRLATMGLLEYGLRMLSAAAAMVTGPFRLMDDAALDELHRGGAYRTVIAVARGLVLAMLPLLVFGTLFASADLVFAHLVAEVLRVQLPVVFERLLFVVLWAWPAAGLLRTLTRGETKDASLPLQGRRWTMGMIETATVLGAVNVLFMVFVFVQLRYLFGGAPLVQETLGLTYAQYARRGFFELTAAAALVLPLLLAADRLVHRPGPRQERILHGLAVTLVGLVYVTLASAVYRMVLYQQAYGLTELRLLVLFFLGWLAFVLAWLPATMITGRRRRFLPGVLVASYVAAAALVAANPHGLIAQVNLNHYAATGRFDAAYAAGLSADAVPALVTALPTLPEPDRTFLAAVLLDRWGAASEDTTGWRSWNLGRRRAAAAVEAHRAELEAAAGRD